MKGEFFLFFVLTFLIFPKKVWADIIFPLFGFTNFPPFIILVTLGEAVIFFLYYHFWYLEKKTDTIEIKFIKIIGVVVLANVSSYAVGFFLQLFDILPGKYKGRC